MYKINIRPSFRCLYERPSLAPSHKINTRRSFACLYERPSLAPALEPTTAAYYSYTLYCLTDWPERWTRAAAAAAVRDFAKTLVISKLKMEETYFLGVSLIRLELVVLIDTEPGKVGYTWCRYCHPSTSPRERGSLGSQRSAALPLERTRGRRSRIYVRASQNNICGSPCSTIRGTSCLAHFRSSWPASVFWACSRMPFEELCLKKHCRQPMTFC